MLGCRAQFLQRNIAGRAYTIGPAPWRSADRVANCCLCYQHSPRRPQETCSETALRVRIAKSDALLGEGCVIGATKHSLSIDSMLFCVSAILFRKHVLHDVSRFVYWHPPGRVKRDFPADGRHFLCRRSSTNIFCTTFHVLCAGILPAPFSAQRFMLRFAPWS